MYFIEDAMAPAIFADGMPTNTWGLETNCEAVKTKLHEEQVHKLGSSVVS